MPSVELVTLAGDSITLDEFRGRPVLLDFWATWCAPCVAQLEALESFRSSATGAGVEVLAASIDADAGMARRYLAQKFPEAGFRALHDPGGEALSSFGADGIPALFLIDATGIVRMSHFGPGGADRIDAAVAALAGRPAPSATAPQSLD